MSPKRVLAIWTSSGAASGLGLAMIMTPFEAPIRIPLAAELIAIGATVGFLMGLVNTALDAAAHRRRVTRAAELADFFGRAEAVKREAA